MDVSFIGLFTCLQGSRAVIRVGCWQDEERAPVSESRSFTRSAYRRVLRVCSQFPISGLTQATIQQRALSPTKLSFKTCVSFDPRNGICFMESPVARARITSFNARREVLISAPSNRVALSALLVSDPLSLPARSMKLNRPSSQEMRIARYFNELFCP